MKGKVWKFSDNMNTDEIIPARYNITIDPKELAKNVFCEVRPDFKNANENDFVVAGYNFGCGSSREHAAVALKGKNVVVLAKSFSRIFYRNAINIGLPILECDTDKIDENDILEVDLEKGIIKNITKNIVIEAKKMPEFILKIRNSGGIINYLKEHDLEELNN
ncbi:MAG: 3-isopropylmalate dehydratase small subunit [Candidatus Woesearchaeota archaeon]